MGKGDLPGVFFWFISGKAQKAWKDHVLGVARPAAWGWDRPYPMKIPLREPGKASQHFPAR